MSDTKVQNMTALTSASADDLLYIIDDPLGTPLDKKITIANLAASSALIPLTTRGDLLTRDASVLTRLALGGITGSVLTRDATDVAWSAGALSFGGAYTLTIPATGTAALGTGAASTLTYWSGTNTLTTLANSGAQSYLSNNGSGTLAWTAGTPIVGTPGTLTVATTNSATAPHTHSVSSSANPGAAASLLASDASGYLQLTGLGVGIAPGTTNGLLYVSVANTTTSGNINASFSKMVATPAGASSASYRGLFAYSEGAGGSNITGNVVGVFGQAVYSGSATLTSLIGLSFSCTIGSGSVTSTSALDVSVLHNSAGTTSTARGLAITTFSKSAGTISTAIGLSVVSITVGSTNYAIQTGLGTVEFGDTTRIIDKTTAAIGVGGKLEFHGAYTGTSTTTSAKINAAKTTATGGEWGFDLVFQTRLNGSGAVAEHARLISNGGFTLTPQADAVQFLCTGFSTQATATAMAQITRNDTAAGVSAMLGLTALGSGAAGDGGSVLFNGKSSTTAATAMARLRWKWDTATHASRAAALILSAYDTAERDIIEIGGNGSAGTLGFFAATKVVKQTGCAVPTDLATCIAAITALRTALNNYGLTTVV